MKNLKDFTIKNKMTYEAYFELTKKLVDAGKTTGQDQSESMVEYTRLNFQRMKRWNKTAKLSDEVVEQFKTKPKMVWICLTESWCGDAAQNLPYIAKLAAATGSIELKCVLRDENLDLMDSFLTNGSRSIPKLIMCDSSTGDVIGTWGPRPAQLQTIVMENKAKGNAAIPYAEFSAVVHKWYALNKNSELEKELLSLVQEI